MHLLIDALPTQSYWYAMFFYVEGVKEFYTKTELHISWCGNGSDKFPLLELFKE